MSKETHYFALISVQKTLILSIMPTDWEARYQIGDTPWDKGAPSPGLVDFLIEHPMLGRVLVPGCGLGYDVREIASRGAEVVGLDISLTAIAKAAAVPHVRNEQYLVGDLFEAPPDFLNAFDWVCEHTCFCAIDPEFRIRYARSVFDALKPGGRFLAIFYMNPDVEPGETGPPFGVTRQELDTLFNRGFTLLREWEPERSFSGRESRELMRLYTKKR